MELNIMQVTYVLNGFMVRLLFYCQIIIYGEKVTCSEKFSHNLTLEVQIVWKMMKVLNFQKFQLWRKIFKNVTSPTQQTAWKKLFTPLSTKSFLRL